MTIITDTPAPPGATNEHAGWFADVRRILKATEAAGIGLPLPQISGTLATFHFTGITHAKDAREAVAMAETLLSYQLLGEFTPRPVPAIGSSAHYVLSAWMPSGLRVDIVARAGIFDSPEAREDARKLVAA